MHFCLPGVPDIFSQMVVSVLASRKGLGPPPPLPLQPNTTTRRLRFFEPPMDSAWLRVRGVSAWLEQKQTSIRPRPSLPGLWWWPFGRGENCSAIAYAPDQ